MSKEIDTWYKKPRLQERIRKIYPFVFHPAAIRVTHLQGWMCQDHFKWTEPVKVAVWKAATPGSCITDLKKTADPMI